MFEGVEEEEAVLAGLVDELVVEGGEVIKFDVPHSSSSCRVMPLKRGERGVHCLHVEVNKCDFVCVGVLHDVAGASRCVVQVIRRGYEGNSEVYEESNRET